MINRITLLLFIGLAFAQDVTIAVLDFDGDGVSQSETRTLTNRLRDEIFNTGIYIVLERGKMDEVLKEQGFQQTGCVTSECAVEVGNMLGVKLMIGGSIGKVGNIYTVSARVIDVQTGEVLKSANYDHIGEIEGLLIEGMNKVASELTGKTLSSNNIENNNSNKYIKNNNMTDSNDLEQSLKSIKEKRKKDKEYNDNKISITNLQNSLVIKHGNTILTGVEFYRILGLNAEEDKRIKYYKKLLRDYELNPYTERQIEIENPIYIIVQQIIGSGSIVFGFGSWLIEDFPPEYRLSPWASYSLMAIGAVTAFFGPKIIKKMPKKVVKKKIPKKKPVLSLGLSINEIDSLAKKYNRTLYNRIYD